MDGRIAKLPQAEFDIFSAALSLLAKLQTTNSNADWQHLIERIKIYSDEDIKSINKHIGEFINKFNRRSGRRYGEEGFDLRALTYLNTRELQEQYLHHEKTFQYQDARQLINIVSKTLSHFHLIELAKLFKINYFDQVDFVLIQKFLDPEHKPGEYSSPVTRYASLLTTMNSKAAEAGLPRPNPHMFAMESGFRLIPKNKMNPRLPLSLKVIQTPEEIKYQITEKEYLVDVTEIVTTIEMLKCRNNEHASKTPGPLYLSSFPIVSALDPGTQVLRDLVYSYNVASVVTIEEEFIAENIYDGEIKALPSDWLQHDVAVGLIQWPDLHTMRIFHTLLAAQYLFSETIAMLNKINNHDYIYAMNELMAKRFEEANINPNIKPNYFLHTLFHRITDNFFSSKDYHEEINFLNNAMTRLKWNNPLEKLPPEKTNNVLIHCKAGVSRSATALLSMYIYFIDIILKWHFIDFIQDDKDKAFFGAILKAILQPSNDRICDVYNFVRIFVENYRAISPLPSQILVLAQLIQYKRDLLLEKDFVFDNNTPSQKQGPHTFHNIKGII